MDAIEIMKLVTSTRDLVWAVLGLNALVTLSMVLQIWAAWRRLNKSASNGHEPGDSLTFKGFDSGMAKLDGQLAQRTKDAVENVNHETDSRFSALLAEQKTQRKKMNNLLIIMRDMRAFMIYGKMPTREIIPIEDEDEV